MTMEELFIVLFIPKCSSSKETSSPSSFCLAHKTTKSKSRRGLGLAKSPQEQGGGEWGQPGCGRTPPTSWAHLALAVPLMHLGSVQDSFLFFLSQTDPKPL